MTLPPDLLLIMELLIYDLSSYVHPFINILSLDTFFIEFPLYSSTQQSKFSITSLHSKSLFDFSITCWISSSQAYHMISYSCTMSYLNASHHSSSIWFSACNSSTVFYMPCIVISFSVFIWSCLSFSYVTLSSYCSISYIIAFSI